MKFYIIHDEQEAVCGCETSLQRAKQRARELVGDGGYMIELVDVEVTSENIRRLLGQLGGYANECGEVYRREPK